MTPYVVYANDFTRADLDVLRDATSIVDALPNPPKGKPALRCHEVARVVGKLLRLRVIDCKLGAMEHSVCLVREASKRQGAVLLDPYCPGRMPQVQLVYQWTGAPIDAQYRSSKEPRTDINEKLVEALAKRHLK